MWRGLKSVAPTSGTSFIRQEGLLTHSPELGAEWLNAHRGLELAWCSMSAFSLLTDSSSLNYFCFIFFCLCCFLLQTHSPHVVARWMLAASLQTFTAGDREAERVSFSQCPHFSCLRTPTGPAWDLSLSPEPIPAAGK